MMALTRGRVKHRTSEQDLADLVRTRRRSGLQLTSYKGRPEIRYTARSLDDRAGVRVGVEGTSTGWLRRRRAEIPPCERRLGGALMCG
jgi:hypothetical protein